MRQENDLIFERYVSTRIKVLKEDVPGSPAAELARLRALKQEKGMEAAKAEMERMKTENYELFKQVADLILDEIKSGVTHEPENPGAQTEPEVSKIPEAPEAQKEPEAPVQHSTAEYLKHSTPEPTQRSTAEYLK